MLFLYCVFLVALDSCSKLVEAILSTAGRRNVVRMYYTRMDVALLFFSRNCNCIIHKWLIPPDYVLVVFFSWFMSQDVSHSNGVKNTREFPGGSKSSNVFEGLHVLRLFFLLQIVLMLRDRRIKEFQGKIESYGFANILIVRMIKNRDYFEKNQ